MTETPNKSGSLKKVKRRSKRWSKDEDTIICQYMNQVASKGKWSVIARRLPNRTGKQCRERWYNQVVAHNGTKNT